MIISINRTEIKLHGRAREINSILLILSKFEERIIPFPLPRAEIIPFSHTAWKSDQVRTILNEQGNRSQLSVYSTGVVGRVSLVCIPDNVRIIIPCPVKDSCSFLDTASSVFSSTLPYHREPKYPRMEKPKDTRGEKSLCAEGTCVRA